MDLTLDLESFSYGDGPSLFQPARLRVTSGETIAVVGGSGDGKSSLLAILAGLHPQPLGGSFVGRVYTTSGKGPASDGDRGIVGYLSSEPHLFLTGFCETVLEEIGWTLFGWGWTPQRVEDRVRETLRDLDLEELALKNPSELSGGQQQMVALASVWATQPDLLLLDEPVSRLDPQSRLLLCGAVKGLARRGVSVIWATSNLAEVNWCQVVWHLVPGTGEVRPYPAAEWDPGGCRAVRPWDGLWSVAAPLARGRVATRGTGGPIDPPGALAEMPALECCNLHFTPSGETKPLLRDLNWQLAQGEIHGLMGPNGAGKTTLARLLRALLAPEEGTIKVLGHAIAGFGERPPISTLASSIAYTFQEPSNLFLKATVRDELMLSGELLSLPQDSSEARTEEAMKLFGLAEYSRAHPRELPASIASLLGVALSWFAHAPVQILDEPLARLDAVGRSLLERALEGWREERTTVVVIAHDLDWLLTQCSSFTVLDSGRITAQGAAREVFSVPEVIARLGVPKTMPPLESDI